MEFKCKKPSIEPSVSQLSSNSLDSVSSETVKRPRRSVVREDSLMTHDQMVAKWMENPEFRKAVFELDAQYASLDKALMKSKLNCLAQANDTRKRTPFRSVLQRPERRAMEDKH